MIEFKSQKGISVKVFFYHLVSQSIAALCSCRWPAPCPALASVAMMTMSSGKPVPSPLASMSVAMGMRVLRRTVHTPSPTWLLSRTIWVVRSCKSCRFSCTMSSCSESFGGAAVIRVNQDCRREGSTQASWAREPHRHSKLGFGLFSAEDDSITRRLKLTAETFDVYTDCHLIIQIFDALKGVRIWKSMGSCVCVTFICICIIRCHFVYLIHLVYLKHTKALET